MGRRIIYRVVNKATGESYIGASSKSLEDRMGDHLGKAKRGDGSWFQRAIATYGPEAFEWEQIDTANDPNDLAEKERRYILEFNTKERGYNSDSGGGFKKQVYQYDVEDLSLVGEFDSLEEAAKAVDAHKNSIANTCCGANRTCKWYYWSYQGPEKFLPPDEGRRKGVIQVDLEGNILAEYPSVAEASRATGISKTCIARVCRGERPKSRGFIWMYAEESQRFNLNKNKNGE
jgi:hypothetical protein